MTTSAAPGRATSDTPKTRRVGRLVAALVLLVVAMASSGLLGARAADKAPGTLNVVGIMPAGQTIDSGAVMPMWLDTARHEGVQELSSGGFLTFDLAGLRPTAVIPVPLDKGWTGNSQVGSGTMAAVDEKHSRIFWPHDTNGAAPTADNTNTTCPQHLFVLNLVDNSWTRKDVPCYDEHGLGAAGVGAAIVGFSVDGMSYYEPTNKLYVTGQPSPDQEVSFSNPLTPQEPTIIRELDPDTLAVSWEYDASSLCDWHQVAGPGGGLNNGVVSRVGDNVLLYCHKGGRSGAGQIIDIPLQRDKEGKEEPNTAAVRAMTAVSVKSVVVDPVTGRMLLIAPGAPFGPAVWVYSGVEQRFLGVVPTGVQGAFLAGFDVSTGRLYLHDSRGIVLVDARHDPVPGGVRYDTLAGPIDSSASNNPVLAVDPTSHRLIIPDFADVKRDPKTFITGVDHFQIVEDDVPPLVDVCANKPKPCPNPDAGTEDIPEVPGQTGHTFTSGANAFGVHLLNTGGIPSDIQNLPGDTNRTVNGGNFDCFLPDSGAPLPCLTTAVLSPGDREGFLAQTSLAQGSALGSTGYATAGRVGPNDHATDADIREAGNCEADRLGALFGSADLQNGIQTLCQNDNMPQPLKDTLANMRAGTARKDGSEYPINGSLCVDFGGTSGEKMSQDPSPQMGYSKVHCDAAAPLTTTDAEFALVGQPQVPKPDTLAIAHSTSHADSKLTDKGVITTVNALAEGINIGGQITIGSIATSAETGAHGRTGTAYTTVKRTISDVHGPGIDCVAACDPKKVADAINQAFAPRIQAFASDPAQDATPKGFTGSVGKDPSLQAADSLINDDDSLTWDGLDLLVVNDQTFFKNSAQGQPVPSGNRSRLLIGLAGVQAESHYGIFKLPPPDSGGGGGTEATPPAPGTPDIPPTPGQEISIPGTPGTPASQAGTLGYHLAGSVGTPPTHKKRPSLVAQLLHGLLHPFEGLKNFWALIINHPFEAVMVFLMLALLGTPVYLALRRREMARALLSEA